MSRVDSRLVVALRRDLFLPLAVAFVVFCNACGASVVGTYRNERNKKEFLELKANGTFYLKENGMGVTGKYEIEGKTITLKMDMGFAVRGTINGDVIVDDDGERWIRDTTGSKGT